MLLLYLAMIEKEEDLDKFNRLYQKYAQSMYFVAFLILKNAAMSEDAVQLAFIRLTKNLYKVEEENEDKTRGYLLTITRNVALSMLKKYQKDMPVSAEEVQLITRETAEYEENPDVLPEEHALGMERVAQLKKALSQLKPAHQDILMLVYFHRIKVGKAAELLGIPGTAARKRLQRAKAELQTQLKKEGFDEYTF